MKGKFAIALCGLVAASFVALPMGTVAQDELLVSTGDWWNYVTEESIEGMVMDFEYKISVDSTDTVGGEDVFVLIADGSGDVSGSMDNMTMAGEVTVSGVEHRTQSEFSLVSNEYVVSMEIDAMIMTFSFDMGVSMEYEPPMDDYIGDNAPAMGVSVTSECDAEMVSWMDLTDFLGTNESESMTSNISMTMEVIDDSDSVTVPAGTFDCMKIEIVTTVDGETVTSYSWYSEEVGNYVKMEGTPESLAGFGADAELESYSFGEGESFISSLFGENWWILALVIAVVVVLLIVVLMMGRKKKAMMMAPPQEMQMQGPPPPPPTS